MDHVPRMGIRHRVADADEDVEQPAQRVIAFLVFQDFGEAAALDHLHREETAAIRMHAELMDRHDVGMFELAGDLGLFDEAGLHVVVGMVEQKLDGDFAANVLIDGPHDRPHAAARDFAFDLVIRLRFQGFARLFIVHVAVAFRPGPSDGLHRHRRVGGDRGVLVKRCRPRRHGRILRHRRLEPAQGRWCRWEWPSSACNAGNGLSCRPIRL